jgi:putative intracellular protease/amidase
MLLGYVIRYPECIMLEVELAIELLKDKTQLQVIDLAGLPPHSTPDFLLIPGGSCDLAIINKELHQLIQEVRDRDGLLAAICNGALVLASAGILVGHQCTHTAIPKYAPIPEFEELLRVATPLFVGSIYVDEDVVISKNIITAKPRATREFAEAVAQKLKITI